MSGGREVTRLRAFMLESICEVFVKRSKAHASVPRAVVSETLGSEALVSSSFWDFEALYIHPKSQKSK